MHRSSTQNGTYSKVTTGNVTTSPADFDNQAREYWYKARGKNCSTSARISCSGWSWSNAVRVPPVSTTTPPPTVTPNTQDPPTSLGVTRYGPIPTHASVAYTQSSGSIHYYQIELHSAATENGTYSLQATANDSTTSPAIFQYQPTGSWFKARGRNCSSAERTDCGTWSDWSPAISPPPHILIYQLASSIEPRQSVPVSGWAFHLDPSSSYSIRITTDNGDIGFDTPHSFWVKGDASSREAKQLKREIDSPTGRYAWLKRGDWECSSIAPAGPVPSCLKHDVAFASLQKFAGQDADAPLANEPDGDELDEAWNPRNKALADEKLRADIRRYGCQDQSGGYAAFVCRTVTRGTLADSFHYGVAEKNHKGWPVTTADIDDFTSNYKFKVCNEPVVPTVSGLAVSKSGDTITASWDFEAGCVSIALADVAFGVEWRALGLFSSLIEFSDTSSCGGNGNRLTCTYDYSYVPDGTFIVGVSIFVIPVEKKYGGNDYGGEGTRGRRYMANVGPIEF